MIREQILYTIKKYNLIQENDIIIVAVSGGPDSMCLLDNLLHLKEELKIKELIVAHVNHMLRKEAKEETKYVEKYCADKNIRCFTKFSDIIKIAQEEKIGTEEAGRKERYKFFDEIANQVNANKIAIAHNKNDNIETLLMHMIRGSGVSGLCGIRPNRQGKYIRPLIKCDREKIEEYCQEQKLQPKYDKSNNDNTYTRNKIRNELIPYLKKEFNPNIIDTIDRLSDLITDEEDYMEKVTLDTFNEILIDNNKNEQERDNDSIKYDNDENCDKIKNNQKKKYITNSNEIILNLNKFNKLDDIIKSRIIMYTVKELFGSSKGIEKKHVEDIIKLCGNNIGNKYLTPNKHIKILVKNKKIYFIKQ